MLSLVPRRFEVHSSYHQLRKETHFSYFRTHAFTTVVKNCIAFFISHRPPLTQTGLSSMARSQSEYQASIMLGAVQIDLSFLWCLKNWEPFFISLRMNGLLSIIIIIWYSNCIDSYYVLKEFG